MPMGCENGTGGPTGVVVYEGAMFPDLNGAVLDADAGRSLVFMHRPEPEGGTLALRHGLLIEPAKDAAGERGHWFRPSDVAVAPDGSILVADWWDPGVGGHAAGDREAYGRILRLVPAAGPRGWGPLDASLDSPAPNVRGSVAMKMLAASESPAPAAATGNALRDAQRLMRRVWIWAQQEKAPAALREAAQHADPRVRLAYSQASRLRQDPSGLSAVTARAKDASAMVRAGVLTMLRDRSWEECSSILTPMALAYPGKDRALLEAIGIAADGKEEQLFAALLLGFGDAAAAAAAGGQGGPLFELAWRLHPPGALELLRRAATSPGAQPGVARAAADAIAFMPEREAAEVMVALALAGPAEHRAYAAWWVRQNSTSLWRAHGVGDAVGGEFAQAKRVWESELLRADGRASVDVDVTGADVIWLVVEDGGDGMNYDWADWIEPRFISDNQSTRLTSLEWLEAQAGWGEARMNAAAAGGKMTVAGQAVADGIGTHANSRIGFRVPAGADKFVAACAPDDGGARSPGTATSIRFAVHLERKPDRARLQALEASALAGDQAAALTLAETMDGAVFLIARVSALSAAVRAAIAPKLQNHPDLAVRALASRAFPRKTASGEQLPALDQLAGIKGDVGRGRELFRGRGTCSSCHVVSGLGGALGPELSQVHKKFGRRELLDAMLSPSAAIAFGFDSWTLYLKDGRVLAGSILADGDLLVLRDFSGQRQVVEAAQIARREKVNLSLMPEAPALGLGAQDLADLAAFLADDPDKEPVFGPEVALFNGRNLDGWNWHLPAGADAAKTWNVKDGVLRCEGQPAGYVYTKRSFTNYELTLEWRFDPGNAGNSGVLCRVQEPHQVWPRSLEAQLNSGDAGDIWNIGEFRALAAAERTEGRHTVKLLPSSEKPLGEWNRYRIRLDHGRFTLEVNGIIQNVAEWCEELAGPIGLQSEGAIIEYRNVKLREILD
jgi:putative heme-binding domain-containing protein